ncbi:hypothetical protein DIPPA_22604, partial [Diplonema papillatum]
TSEYGECSTACGSGTSCRTVECDRCDGQASNLCDASLKPAPCQDCRELPSYWATTPYSTCSATQCMEVGKKTRTVTCEPCTPEDGGSYVGEFEPCEFETRPTDFEPCQFVSHNWKVLANCQQLSTGATRTDGCLDGLKETICINCVGAPVEDSECTETKPAIACIIPVYAEELRPWTECDATCGQGSIYRVAYCYKKCDASKKEVNAGLCPAELTDTKETACSVYTGGKVWSAWGPCTFASGSCGDGTEKRQCQYKCNSEVTTGCSGANSRACRVTCPKKKSCHPASSVVHTPSGPVSVKDIRSGDLILTCAAPATATSLSLVTGRQSGCHFTRVYGFHHREEAETLDFVEVRYSSECTSEGVLRISKDHLFAVNGVFVQAQFAKVGDAVVTSCAADGTYRRVASTITGIEVKEDLGQYAFGTDSGDSLVDGILTSNYAGDLPQWRFELLFLPLRALMSATGSSLTSDAAKFHWYVVGLCSLGGRTDLSGDTFDYWLTGAAAAMLIVFFVVLPRTLAAVVVGTVGLGKARERLGSDVVHLAFLVWCCLACGAADEVPAVQVLLAAGLVMWFARSVQGALSCVPELVAGPRQLPSGAHAAKLLNVLCGTSIGWAWMRGDGDIASIRGLVTPDATAAAIFAGAFFLLRNRGGSPSKGSRLAGPVLGLLGCSLIWQVAAGADTVLNADDVHETSRVLGTETDHVVQFTAQSTVHMPCKGRQSHTTGCTESVSGHRVGNMRFSRVETAGGEFCYSVDLLMFAEHQDRVTPFLTVHPDIEEWNKVPLTVCRSVGGAGVAPEGSAALRFYVPIDANLTERTKEKIRFLQPFDLLITHGEGGVCETWVPAANEQRQKHDGVHNATLDHAITAEFADGLLKQVSVDTSVTRSDDYISAKTTAHATVLHETPRLQRGARVLDVKEHQEVFLHSETEFEKPVRATNTWFEEFEGLCTDAEVTILEVAKRGQEHPAEAAEVLRSMLMAPYEALERVRFLFIAGFMAEKETADLVGWCVGNEFCTRGLQMEDTGRLLSSAAMSWQNRWNATQSGYSKAAMALLTTKRADDYSVGDLTYTALQHAETALLHDDAATMFLGRMEWEHTWRATAAHNMKMTPKTRAALHGLVDDMCSSAADLHTCTPYLQALKKDPTDVDTRDKLIEVASMHPHTTARLRAVEVLMDRTDVSCGHMQYLLDTETSEHIRATISTIKPAGGRCLRVLFFDKTYGIPVKDRTRTLGGSFANVRMVSKLGAEVHFKGSAKWTDLSYDFGAEAVAKAEVKVSVLGGLATATVFKGSIHFKAKISAGFDFKQLADKAVGDLKGVVGLSNEESPTKRTAKELESREMTPLEAKPPLVPYIALPPIATESPAKMQAFCDRLHALNFPFYGDRPYTASGCTAEIAKHPWSLFRYIYDRTEGATSNDAAIGEAVFSDDAERWVEWSSSHTTTCLTIWPDLSQFERFAPTSTFSYMNDIRMCAFAKALGTTAALITGITHSAGFVAYYPAGHSRAGQQVHETHKFGKDIDIAIPSSLQWKSGAAKPSDAIINKMAKACAALASGNNVIKVIVGPSAYKDAIKAVDPTNSCGRKVVYASGHSNHFHVSLADSTVPAPPEVIRSPLDWILQLEHLGYGGSCAQPVRADPGKQEGTYAPRSNVEKLLFAPEPVPWQQVETPSCVKFKIPGASWATSATGDYMDRALSACDIRDVLQVTAVEVELSDKEGETGAAYQRNGRSVAVTVPCMAAGTSLDAKCTAEAAEVVGHMYEEGTVEQILVPPDPPNTIIDCDISKNEYYLEFAGSVIRDQKLVDITCEQFGIFNKDKKEGRNAVALSDKLYEREWKLFQERTAAVGLLPYAKAHLTVGGAVDLFLAKAGIEVAATIADITVPLYLRLRAEEFPIDTCMDGTLEIRPLAIKVSFLVSIRDKFKIGWFYIKWTWGSKWRYVLYQWSAPPVIIPLFTTCKGTPEVSEPMVGRVAASQHGPYGSSLDSRISYSKTWALGATESVSVGSIAGSNGDVTRALVGETGGHVKSDFAGVDGETYQVSLKTCTSITRDRHCTDTVVQTLIFDDVAPEVSIGWFGLDVQASTGHALVTYPKMLCFDVNYTDTSYLSEYAMVVKNSGNGSVAHQSEGRFYVNPCMRDLVLENNQVYTLTVSVADAVYHTTTVEASFIADLTPVVLKAIATTCEGEPGLQWAVDRICVAAAVFSRPLTAVRYEWSAFTSGGKSFSGLMQENASHVFFEQGLNETMDRGAEFTVILYAIYGNRIAKFQGPVARIAVDPVVVVTAQPCQHVNQDICFEVEKSSEISVVHGRVGDQAQAELGPSGCLPHSQAVPGEVAVSVWGCNVFGQCSPTSQLSVAMRNGVPECSVARDSEYVITPSAVCFDFNVSSDLGCGLRRVTAFLELVGRRGDVVDPDTAPAVNRSEENVGQRATMHCFATPLQDLSVYRVGLVAVDANGEQTSCSVAAVTDLSPPTPSLQVKNQFQLPTGSIEFTMVPPARQLEDPDTEASLALEVRLFSVSDWSSNETFDWSERSDVAYDGAPVPYTIQTGDRTGRFVIAAVAQDRAGNAVRVVNQIVVDSTPPTVGTVKIGSAAAHRSKLPTNIPLVVDFGLGECGQSLNVVNKLVSVTGPHGILLHRDSLVASVMDTCRGGASIYCNGREPFGSQADCVEMACSAGGNVLTAQANSHSTGAAATVCRQGVRGLYTSHQAPGPHCSPLYDQMSCRDLAFQVSGFPITRTVGGCVNRVSLAEFFAGPQKACHTTTLGDRHPVLQSDTHVMHFAGSSFMASPTESGESGIGINGLTLSDEGCRDHATCHIEYPQSVKFFCIPNSLRRRDESPCGTAGDDESGMTCNVTLVDGASGTVLEVLRSSNNEKSVTSAETYATETVITAEVQCTNAVGMHVAGISAHTLILDPPPGRMESVGGLYLSAQGVTIDVEFEDVQEISVCIGAWEGDCMYAAKTQPVGGIAEFPGPFPVESFLFATAFVETTRGLSFEHSIDPMMIDLTPPDEGVFEVDCGCGDDCEYVTKDAVGELRCLLTWAGFDDVAVNVNVSLSGVVLASGMRADGTLEFALEREGDKFLVGLSDDNAAPAAGRKVESRVPFNAGTPLVFALEASNLAGLQTTAAVEKYPSGCHPEPDVALLGVDSGRSGTVGSMSVLAVGDPPQSVCFEASYPHGRVCKVTVLFKDPKTGATLLTAEPDTVGDKIEVCGLEAVLPRNQPFTVRVISARCKGCSATQESTLFLDSAPPTLVFGAGTVNTKDPSFCVDPSVASDITLAKLTVTATDTNGTRPRVSLGCARKSGLSVPVDGVQQVWWEPRDWVCITEAAFESFVELSVSLQLVDEATQSVVATSTAGTAEIRHELEPGAMYSVSALAVDVFGRQASSTTEPFVSRPEEADVPAVALLPTQGETLVAGLPHWKSTLCLRSPAPPSAAEQCVVVAWLAIELPENVDAAFDEAVSERSPRAFFSGSPDLCLSAADVVSVAGYDSIHPMEFFVRTQCWDRFSRAAGPSEGKTILDRKPPTAAIKPIDTVSSDAGGVEVKYGAQDDYLAAVTVVIWQLEASSMSRKKVMGQASASNPVNSADASVFVSVELPEERYLAVVTAADAAGNQIESKPMARSGSASLVTLRRPAAAFARRMAFVLNTFDAGEDETLQGVTYIPEQTRVFKIRLNDSLPISRVEMCLSTQGSACDLKDMGLVPSIDGAYQYPVVAFEAGGDGRVFYVTLRYCLALCDTVDVGPFMFETTPPMVTGQLSLPGFAATGQDLFVDWADHFAEPDTELEFSVCLSNDVVSPCFAELSPWSDRENLTVALPDDLEGRPVAVCAEARNRGRHTSRLCGNVFVTNEAPVIDVRYGAENASEEGVLAQFGVTVSWNVTAQVPLKKCRVRLTSTVGLANSDASQVLPAEEFANVDNTTEEASFNMSNYEGGWVDVGGSYLWVFAFEPVEGEELVTRLCCTLENDREECVDRQATAVVAQSWEDAYYMGSIDLTPPECTWDAESQLSGIRRGPHGGYFFNGTSIGLLAGGCTDRESNVTYTFCLKAAGSSDNCTESYDLETGQSATLRKHFEDGEKIGVQVAAAQPWGRSAAVHEHIIEQNLGVPIIQLPPSAEYRMVGEVGTRNLCFPLLVYDANGIDTFSCSDEFMLLSVCNQTHLCLNTTSPRSGFVQLLAHDTFGFGSSTTVEVVVEEKDSKSYTVLIILVVAAAVVLVLAAVAFWLLCVRSSAKKEHYNKDVPKEVEHEMDGKQDAGGNLPKECDEPFSDVMV